MKIFGKKQEKNTELEAPVPPQNGVDQQIVALNNKIDTSISGIQEMVESLGKAFINSQRDIASSMPLGNTKAIDTTNLALIGEGEEVIINIPAQRYKAHEKDVAIIRDVCKKRGIVISSIEYPTNDLVNKKG